MKIRFYPTVPTEPGTYFVCCSPEDDQPITATIEWYDNGLDCRCLIITDWINGTEPLSEFMDFYPLAKFSESIIFDTKDPETRKLRAWSDYGL